MYERRTKRRFDVGGSSAAPPPPPVRDQDPWPREREDEPIPLFDHFEDTDKAAKSSKCRNSVIEDTWDDYDSIFYNEWLRVSIKPTRFVDPDLARKLSVSALSIDEEVLTSIDGVALISINKVLCISIDNRDRGEAKLTSNTKPDTTACLGAWYTWERILQTSVEDNRFKQKYRHPTLPSIDVDEEKDEYGVYRNDQGCARDVDGHIINVSKDDIRKLMERASRDEHNYICLPEHASSFTQTKLVPEIYTKDEINEMLY
ncbi:hypothetical protein DY000_02007309 [Brassica cretica]|uniref:Uncharacterized protein n=1 Tax=Brassica cretica TaxID=69181 RepID=A0ABQ7C8C2_BRACR|nr:hypothetical protein DY000_02007309 [Brassica cretica]